MTLSDLCSGCLTSANPNPFLPFSSVTDRLYSQGCEARDRKRADMKKRLDEVPNALEGTGANIAKTTPSNWSRGTRDKSQWAKGQSRALPWEDRVDGPNKCAC